MSPTSGFHHARYYNGGAFCTFNGLAVTVQLLKKNHNVKNIGIVDFDAHWGDGTEDIIEKLKIKDITHLSHGKIFGYRDSNGIPLKNLYKTLDAVKDCEILLYQAGADPHVNDPLGGDLTTEQMLERDRIVFKFAKNNNIPIVWNLAGGYQKDFSKVLEIHENTLKACIEVYE
jgi:acetoin utilization deacetylase AcuC-like enzyme